MKKLLTVSLCVLGLVAVGYFIARYFDGRFRDYERIAQVEIGSDAQLFYMENACGVLQQGALDVYLLENGEHSLKSAFTGRISGRIVANTENYAVFEDGDAFAVWRLEEGRFSAVCRLEGGSVRLKQFGRDAYIRVTEADGSGSLHYLYNGDTGVLEDLSAKVDFTFTDYCRNMETGEVYYLLYRPVGEFVRTEIRYVNSSGEGRLAEIDNLLYNEFYYLDGVFALIAEEKLLFLEADTFVSRQFNYHDTSALVRILLDKYAVFLAEEGYYFDGVNNFLIAGRSADKLSVKQELGLLCGFKDRAIYASGNAVYAIDAASGAGGDAPLFSLEGEITQLGCIGRNKIAAVCNGTLYFMEKTAGL